MSENMESDESSVEQPEPEPEQPEPEQRKKGRTLSEEEKRAIKLRNKIRADEIRLLMKYYSVTYETAQKKYAQLATMGIIEETLEKARKEERADSPKCPLCGKETRRRLGKFGEFWGCPDYPNCRGVINIVSDIKGVSEEKQKDTLKKLQCALKYIDEIGGSDEALRWLNVAILSLTDERSR